VIFGDFPCSEANGGHERAAGGIETKEVTTHKTEDVYSTYERGEVRRRSVASLEQS
jgi:hypothetical protein